MKNSDSQHTTSSAQIERAVIQAKSERGLAVTALVCMLNEVDCLPSVLPMIPDWLDEVLLVDGHSTDGTAALAKELRPTARILTQPNRGKGDALRYGVSEANGDIVVTLDADGETDPREIARFVAPLLEGYDFAKGSRLARGKPTRMPRHRWFGNKILAQTFNVLYGTRYSDICSGYNGFWKRGFLQIPLTHKTFHMDQQLLSRVHKARLKVKEVPHHSDGRVAGVSKTSDIKQGLIDLAVIVAERFRI